MADATQQAAPKAVDQFHLNCIYHGDLGAYDSEAAASAAGVDHFKNAHADAAGNVAANAEVVIHTAKHIRAADLAAK